MALGIDIYARYQTVTNWQAVKNHGVSYVWVKLTDGSGKAISPGDGLVAGAKSVGIPVGGYHYAQLSPTPEQQAEIFINEVKRLGATGVTPALDLESPFSANSAARDFGIRFCNRVASLGFRPAVYMNNAFAKAIRPDQWGIGGLVIWLARYGARPDASAGRYDVHQYASDGSVPGISGSVDLNESYSNEHLVGGAAPAAPGGLEDMAFDDVFTTRYGNPLSVRDFMAWVDYRLNEVYARVTGPQQSEVDTAASLEPLNFIRFIDGYTNRTEKAVAELRAAVEKLSAEVAELKEKAG